MSAPFDTLQLARGFEAAGFPLDQASKMAEAVATATIGADLATKRDLGEMELRLKNQIDRVVIRLGGMLIVAVILLFTGLGTATTIILNRLPPPASTPAPAQRANVQPAGIVLAGEAVDWDRYHDRQDACRELAEAQRSCAERGVFACDQAGLERLQRQCSAFGPLAHPEPEKGGRGKHKERVTETVTFSATSMRERPSSKSARTAASIRSVSISICPRGRNSLNR